MPDTAKVIKTNLGDAAKNASSVAIPGFIFRFAAVFKPSLRALTQCSAGNLTALR
jgi:hypothetical protein